MAGDVSRVVDRPDLSAAGEGSLPDGGRVAGGPVPVDLCRLTVLSGRVQVDLALPTDIPISVLAPGIVDVLTSRAAPGADGAGQPGGAHVGRSWVLSRVGRAPLADTATLRDAAVRDGELLVLGTADSPAPPPLFDDLMDAVATAGGSESGMWTARAAQSAGFAVGAAALLLACLALLQPSTLVDTERVANTSAGIGAMTAALLLVLAGSIVGRLYHDGRTGVFLSACALPLVFVAAIQFVPGGLGAAHVLLGAAATGATAVLALRVGGHGTALFTGVATVAVAAAPAAAALSFTEVPPSTVGAAVSLVALTGLAVAPRVSMMQARLPLPPVPTAGASLDDNDDTDRPTAATLERQSMRARSYLTGSVSAACAAAATGAVLSALGTRSTETYWPGVGLAATIAVVLMLRGRTYADLRHAAALVGSGAVVVLVLLGAAVFGALQPPPVLFAAALGTMLIAVIFGSFVPTRDYSPVMRRAAELIEYAAIAAVIPIVCWVCGLYTAMRAL
ncbi:MAG: type VII secretion integral membrane protein EccD [Rhodococcus sp. (in: high G+C Gram-positive bacteria)]